MSYPTYEELIKRCLDKVDGSFDKSEGSFIYDAIAPACMELAQMYCELEIAENRYFADTSTGEYLERRARERGIVRKEATKALRLGEFNVPIPLGARFAIEDVTYICKTLSHSQVILECEQSGSIGNKYNGKLTPLTHIPGLTSAMLTEIITYGFDNEDDESLRARYYERFDGDGFGGNVKDYTRKVKELEGVGAVKVTPIWNGRGTVKITILDSDFNKPTTELIGKIQEAIDPLTAQGQGKGIAPINHVVTVVAAEETPININANITLQEGALWEDVLPLIQHTVNAYFSEVRKTWESTEQLVVRVTWIESRILDLEGVLDIQETTLNGGTGNLQLAKDNIPKLGTVTKV
jgi:uncharacterized phage protein gp47/JayE